MNYISAEEFLKQSEKVQKEFKKFCKDKFCLCQTNIGIRYVLYLESHIPLLQMHQLVQFIECYGYYIEFNNFQNKKHTVDIYKSLMQTYSNYSITADDLLQALWHVTIKIAEQEVK